MIMHVQLTEVPFVRKEKRRYQVRIQGGKHFNYGREKKKGKKKSGSLLGT